MTVHVAGPVRRGSKQTVQRCVRCNEPLFQESANMESGGGYPLGALIDVSRRGALREIVDLDKRHGGRPPSRPLCRLKSRQQRHTFP